jgi:dienelactone hydrolase
MTVQRKLEFDSQGIKCVGYLHVPDRLGRLPCVILVTGFSGTQDTPSIQAMARALTTAGFAAMSFDFRNFGESGGAPRQVIRLKDQLADIHAAVGCVRAQPDVDPARVALWGTSLGGGHVVTAAAEDPNLKAVVAQIPFSGFPKKVENRSTRATLRLLGAMIRDALRGALGRPPLYIRAVGPTGDLAAMASPQAQNTIEALRSEHWRNEVAPRVLFEMMRYKPSDFAPRVSAPLLVCLAEYDREGPAELVRELARQAKRAEVKSYPVAHFDFYRPEVREQVIRDQLEFLHRHLRAA